MTHHAIIYYECRLTMIRPKAGSMFNINVSQTSPPCLLLIYYTHHTYNHPPISSTQTYTTHVHCTNTHNSYTHHEYTSHFPHTNTIHRNIFTLQYITTHKYTTHIQINTLNTVQKHISHIYTYAIPQKHTTHIPIVPLAIFILLVLPRTLL